MSEKVNRARRYAVTIPLSYRPVGKTGWREGRSENLARNGFSFRTRGLVKPGTQVEIMFQLPSLTLGVPRGKVLCKGRVIRLAGPSGSRAQISYAVKISSYKIVRGLRRVSATFKEKNWGRR